MAELASVEVVMKALSALVPLVKFKRGLADIVSDLRHLRFDDDGVLRLLDRQIAGEKLRDDDLQFVLTAFNDAEWSVEKALKNLTAEEDLVSKLTRDELEAISNMKVNVRKDVQRAMNRSARQPKPDIEELTQIRTAITRLNGAIDKAEHELVQRMRG